jgi:hypothetical protein
MQTADLCYLLRSLPNFYNNSGGSVVTPQRGIKGRLRSSNIGAPRLLGHGIFGSCEKDEEWLIGRPVEFRRAGWQAKIVENDHDVAKAPNGKTLQAGANIGKALPGYIARGQEMQTDGYINSGPELQGQEPVLICATRKPCAAELPS